MGEKIFETSEHIIYELVGKMQKEKEDAQREVEEVMKIFQEFHSKFNVTEYSRYSGSGQDP